MELKAKLIEVERVSNFNLERQVKDLKPDLTETVYHVSVKDVVAEAGLDGDPLFQDFSLALEECKKMISEVLILKRDFNPKEYSEVSERYRNLKMKSEIISEITRMRKK